MVVWLYGEILISFRVKARASAGARARALCVCVSFILLFVLHFLPLWSCLLLLIFYYHDYVYFSLSLLFSVARLLFPWLDCLHAALSKFEYNGGAHRIKEAAQWWWPRTCKVELVFYLHHLSFFFHPLLLDILFHSRFSGLYKLKDPPHQRTIIDH